MAREIQQVWDVNDSDSSPWQVGGTVEKIELKADGAGLSGNYDRIHIYFDDRKIVLPAWACGWVEIGGEDE